MLMYTCMNDIAANIVFPIQSLQAKLGNAISHLRRPDEGRSAQGVSRQGWNGARRRGGRTWEWDIQDWKETSMSSNGAANILSPFPALIHLLDLLGLYSWTCIMPLD